VYSSLGLLLNKFNPVNDLDPGISEMAFVNKSAKLDDNVTIGPFSVIRAGVTIGENSIIFPQVFLGQDVRIGKNVIIYPGVKIYHHCKVGDDCVIHANSVIGSDGFGYSQSKEGKFKKIAQIGNVVLEDRVEVGANTVIDRATMGSTIISSGAKLDNLIQIAHNVEIGNDTAIAAQAGVAGSTKIGRNVMVGGQAGFVGHINIADGTQIQAQSGVTTNVENQNARIYGSPAIDYRNYLKSYAIFRHLPELQKRIGQLEKVIREMEKKNETERPSRKK
jgi:UDP-3-O-[3-hydroxymyristoyl] glucosamine N-acyltransferase